ncbi:MAG: lysophospholipid acyltransferase family protein [Candidatus Binatia bacterium]
MWVPAVTGVLHFAFGYRVNDADRLREQFRRLRRRTQEPLLICANHLTMIDSAIIAGALGSPAWYLRNFASIPWNLPERRNFAYSPLSGLAAYVMKCLPITRGGARGDVAEVLRRFVYVLERGDVGLVFPEGGRSRSGRVDVDGAAPGVGRIVAVLPRCTVLLVYLRGDAQEGFSDLPARGERFEVRLATLRPRTRSTGLRGSRDIARQIVAKLAKMEAEYFDDRKRRRRSRGSRDHAERHASAL